MGNLRENIDYYMNLKGIKKYSDLLRGIALQLGIKGQDSYEFAKREKSNFSKTLNGDRPLKYEFIIPLEKIFGVSLARLLDEDAYKLPVEKENVPFNKGFRYYAYLDDPQLYKNEFDLFLTTEGKSVITQSDEFGKNFLDYVVEYHSVNGVRYLQEEYGIKLKSFHNQFEFSKDKGSTWINFKNSLEFARLVASINDAELFNSIYDTYNMFYYCGYYDVGGCIFAQAEYLELILDNDALFNSIFEEKPYVVNRKKEGRSITYHSINPIINPCLNHALKNLDKYKKQAIKILEFGIEYNRKKACEADFNCYICNELGALNKYSDNDYYELIIFADVETNDDEINGLISQLPKFKNPYKQRG